MELSASNRTRVAYKREGTYPSGFGVTPPGNGTVLNMTGESLSFDVQTEKSKQLRDDRQVQDIVQVGANAQGGIDFEAQYKEYDPLIEAVVQSEFVAYGTLGVGTASAGILTPTSATLLTAATATAGVDAFTTLLKGQWFTIIPHTSASAAVKKYLKGRAFRVSPSIDPTTTALNLDPATPINTSIITAPLAAGWKVSSSRMSNGNITGSFTLEVGHMDVSQFRSYKGMIPSKMSLKLASKGIVTGNFEFMGQGFDLVAASEMGTAAAAQSFTPANATRGVFDILENGASVTASTFVKSLDFSIDNTLRMQDAVGVFGAAGIGSGTMDIQAKLEVYFTNDVMYRKLLDGSASSLSVPILDVDGNGYVYFMPRIKYTAAKVNASGQDQDNMLAVDAQALPDLDSSSPWYGKSLVVFRVGSPAAPSLASLDTRPRFGYGLDVPPSLAEMFSNMQPLTGSVSGGRTGTFGTTAQGASDFTWVAVLNSAVGGTAVSFDDAVGAANFAGAGETGVWAGLTPDPTVKFIPYTDPYGNLWNLYRSNGHAVTYSPFTLS